jgi:hypothetical protein
VAADAEGALGGEAFFAAFGFFSFNLSKIWSKDKRVAGVGVGCSAGFVVLAAELGILNIAISPVLVSQ